MILGCARFAAITLALCAAVPAHSAPETRADDLLVVDCLLPGQIRKLGSRTTYVTPRRPVQTSAIECELRGGEYVTHDRASRESSLRVWLEAAEAGDASAQNRVGEIYERGLGEAPDFAHAARWYARAAEQGFAPAMVNLGQLYERGAGVARDPAVALRWYQRAAELGEQGIVFVPAAPVAPSVSAAETTLRAELAEKQAALAQLERELAALRAALARGEREGMEAAARLAARERELGTLADELADERGRLARQADALAREQRARAETERALGELRERERALAASADELAAAQQKLGTERAELASQEHALRDERAKLARQERELAREAERVDEARRAFETERLAVAVPPQAPALPVAGPTITLIEPPLAPATRGVAIVDAGGASGERTIIGRVEAPAGLMALMLDGRPLAADARGLFRASVQVPADGIEVAVSAVDQQGKRDERRFRLTALAPRGEAEVEHAPELAGGAFHALVIGNDAYRALPRLTTAVADARAIADVLRSRYGFSVRLLLDADRYGVLSALNALRAELTERDNLLIYYAGHGELDEVNARGHWLPVDAEQNSSANWISNVAITDVLNAMSALHVLVVADSCYSGTLTRSALATLDAGVSERARAAWLRTMAGKRSRTALTSGGLAPVLDGGGGTNSVFARALLDVLARNERVLEGQRLFQEVAARVAYAAENLRFEQAPQYAPIKFAGHESGDFLLVPGARSEARAQPPIR